MSSRELYDYRTGCLKAKVQCIEYLMLYQLTFNYTEQQTLAEVSCPHLFSSHDYNFDVAMITIYKLKTRNYNMT